MIDSLLSLIVYFFLGHSGMDGSEAPCEPFETLPRVSYYIGPNKGYESDPSKAHYIPKSMAYPFLKEMSTLYPNYRFAGAKYSRAATQFNEIIPGESCHDRMIESIRDIKKRGDVVGGFIVNYGFCEGDIQKDAQHFAWDARRLINEIRETSGNTELPFLLVRYQSNHQNQDGMKRFREFSGLIVEGLFKLQETDKNIKLVPPRPMPLEYIATDHHENLEGNRILAKAAAFEIQESNFDFWYRGN